MAKRRHVLRALVWSACELACRLKSARGMLPHTHSRPSLPQSPSTTYPHTHIHTHAHTPTHAHPRPHVSILPAHTHTREHLNDVVSPLHVHAPYRVALKRGVPFQSFACPLSTCTGRLLVGLRPLRRGAGTAMARLLTCAYCDHPCCLWLCGNTCTYP